MSPCSSRPTKKQGMTLLPPEAMKRSSQNPSYTVSPIDRSEVKFVLPGSRQAAHTITTVTHMNLIQTAQPFLEPAILEDKWREAQEAKNKNAKSASD